MDVLGVMILCILIALAAIVLGLMSLKRDPGRSRGSEPGTGDHVLQADYQSGLGGHSMTWRVPKDPQEYARKFVPRGLAQDQDQAPAPGGQTTHPQRQTGANAVRDKETNP